MIRKQWFRLAAVGMVSALLVPAIVEARATRFNGQHTPVSTSVKAATAKHATKLSARKHAKLASRRHALSTKKHAAKHLHARHHGAKTPASKTAM